MHQSIKHRIKINSVEMGPGAGGRSRVLVLTSDPAQHLPFTPSAEHPQSPYTQEGSALCRIGPEGWYRPSMRFSMGKSLAGIPLLCLGLCIAPWDSKLA